MPTGEPTKFCPKCGKVLERQPESSEFENLWCCLRCDVRYYASQARGLLKSKGPHSCGGVMVSLDGEDEPPRCSLCG